MNQCTWNDSNENRCTREATHPQRGKNDEIWADLCDVHAKQLDEAADYLMSEDRDPKKSAAKILSSWVRASGGPVKMAKRMMGDK